jgi:hypothetical protein
MVMNKQELRVGNLVEILTSNKMVNLPTGVFAVVEEIRDEKVKLRIGESDKYTYFNRRYDTIRAIKIKEEVLIQLGFEKIAEYNHDFIEKIYGISIIKNSPNHIERLCINLPFNQITIGEYESDEDNYLLNIEINDVNHLQNLYNSLTGSELTFKNKQDEN